MAEYIERETLVNNLELLACHEDKFTRSVVLGVVGTIRAMKSANVAPVVHGYWYTSSDVPDTLFCSNCKCGYDMWKHDAHNYCPNCGALLDLEGNDV